MSKTGRSPSLELFDHARIQRQFTRSPSSTAHAHLSTPPQLLAPCSSSALPLPPPGAQPPLPSPAAPSPPPLCAVRDPPGAIVRPPIDCPAGDAKPEATHDKEAGHSANAPSVLEGYKKLDRTCPSRPITRIKLRPSFNDHPSRAYEYPGQLLMTYRDQGHGGPHPRGC